MMMVKCRLFTFFLILHLMKVGMRPAEIIIGTPEIDEPFNLIEEAAVKIFKACYEKQVKVVGIVGDSPGSLIASLSSGGSFAEIIVGNSTGCAVREGHMNGETRYKLELFAITVSSSKELGDIIMGIKNSRWWNHMAKFYILDWSTSQSEHGCSRAFEMLWAAWRMDLLEAKFICADSTKGRLIYTFNPYTSNAPKPWRLDQIHGGENNHPWALLNREYRGEDGEICENIDFDKTTNLGGYEIRTTISNVGFKGYMNINRTAADGVDSANGMIRRSVFRALKATPKFLVRTRKELMGYVDKEGKRHGFLADVTGGISDMELAPRYVLSVMNSTSISTRMSSSIIILTQYNGQQSQLSKLRSVIDGYTRIGVCLVLSVSLIFLKFFMHQTLDQSIINIIRIISNEPLTDLPDNPASRIYLASLFLFMITIQALYQGRLSAILTKSVPLNNINTMLDLVKSNHTVYSHKEFDGLFNDGAFNKKRLRFEDEIDCTKYVVNEPFAACICEKFYWVHAAGRMKLHVSKESISDLDSHWAIRDNWPLERRLTKIFTRLAESCISTYLIDRAMLKDLRAIEANDNDDMDQGFQVLTLADLSFAFVILAIGLGYAMISFILEIIVG